MWRCVRWVGTIYFEGSIAFFTWNQCCWNDLPLLGTMNCQWSGTTSFASSHFHSFDLPKFPPNFLSYWRIHSSQLFLHPPELGSVTLNMEAVHFADTSEQQFTRLCENPKNDLRLFCVLLSTKNVSVCRMYWLDKCVRVVAIILLLWFVCHSTLLQSTLSGFITSSVFF